MYLTTADTNPLSGFNGENPVNQVNRLDYLDAARGIAAIMVFFYHYLGWRWHESHKIAVNVLSLIFNGSDAVSFFFVLSGMVLSYKYLNLNASLDIRRFYINRVFRLWPAYCFTIITCFLVGYRNSLNGETFKYIFIDDNTRFYEELSLLWAKGHNHFIAGWTLSIEMFLSLFTPFAIILAKYHRKVLLWLSLCLMLSLPLISQFYIHFTLGIIVSAWFDDIRSDHFKTTAAYKYRHILLLLAFVLFSIRHIDSISPLGPSYKYFADVIRLDFFTYTAVASFIFLCYIVRSDKLQRILGHSIFRFYGRISYGVYLMHWVVVSFTFEYWTTIRTHIPGKWTAPIVMLLACFAITTILAVGVYYMIEKPFIRLGRSITKKLKPSFLIR